MEKQRILAMDIGSSAIKMFIAEAEAGSLTIRSHGSVLSKGFEKGALKDPAMLGDAMRQAAECTKLSENDRMDAVVVGVSGMRIKSHLAVGSVVVKSGHVRKDDIEHVNAAAILMETSEHTEVLHVVPRRYRLDGCVVSGLPLGKSGTTLECECSLVTIDAEELNKVREALTIAGLKTDMIVANIYAIHAAADVLSRNQSYILADIGSGHTDFILYEGGNFIKAGSLPIGGEYITRDIMQGLELDFLHAEHLKYYFGKLSAELKGQNVILDCSDENIQDKNVQYDFLYDIIDSRVNELTNIFSEFLSIDLIDREIRSIYLTGGSSLLYNFMNCLGSKFDMDVKLLDMAEMPTEYQGPANAAAYCALQYAGKQLCASQAAHLNEKTDRTDHQSIFHKIKKLFHW